MQLRCTANRKPGSFKSIRVTVFSIEHCCRLHPSQLEREKSREIIGTIFPRGSSAIKERTKPKTKGGRIKEKGRRHEKSTKTKSNRNDGNLCGWRTITFVRAPRKITNFRSVYCRLQRASLFTPLMRRNEGEISRKTPLYFLILIVPTRRCITAYGPENRQGRLRENIMSRRYNIIYVSYTKEE